MLLLEHILAGKFILLIMSKILKKFLLAKDKFLPQTCLRQPDLHIVLAKHLGKKERIQKYKKTEGSK